MALTNAFMALIVAQIGVYVILYRNKVRWVRMVGAFALIGVGVSFVVIEDTVSMYIFFLISLMVAVIGLMKDVASLVK